MGDEQIGDLELVLQILEQGQNAFGHQLVQGRGDLVADDEFRFSGQGPGDADTLLFTPGKLRGKAVDVFIRGQFYLVQEFLDPVLGLLTFHPEIKLQGPAEHGPNPVPGIERRIRHLVDHLQLPEIVLAAFAEFRMQFLPQEGDAALDGRQEAGDDLGQGALAAAGLAHQGHGPAPADIDADVLEHPLPAGVGGVHILDFQDDPVLFGLHFFLAQGAHGQEVPGVLLLGILEQLPGLADFHRVPVAQDHDPVGHLGHHRQVMGDVQGGLVHLLGNLLDRGQDLDLGGHVQGCGRFVEHDDVRLAGHGHGHHGPLQLAAGELVGVAPANLLRGGQEEALVDLYSLVFGLFLAHEPLEDRGLGELPDHPVGRVEGRGRTLGHIGDLRAANRAQKLGRGIEELLSFQLDGARGQAAAVPGVAHGGQADGGFAGPGFADESQDFAPVQLQADPVDNGLPALFRPAFNVQILDFE